MLGYYLKHKEIGNYINESNIDNKSQIDLNEIISISRKIFEKIDEQNIKNKKGKEVLQKYDIYYIVANSDIFYLAVLNKNFEGDEDEMQHKHIIKKNKRKDILNTIENNLIDDNISSDLSKLDIRRKKNEFIKNYYHHLEIQITVEYQKFQIYSRDANF